MADVIINKVQLPNDDNLYNVQDSRVDVLISDAGEQNTIRTIANDELVKALIPENAQAALDTLTEIANWIQNHPNSYAAFVAQYNTHKHSTSYEPEGTISQPTFTGTLGITEPTEEEATRVTNAEHNHSVEYTPEGKISEPIFTSPDDLITTSISGESEIVVNSITSKGTLPTFTSGELIGSLEGTDNKTLKISFTDNTFTQGTLPEYSEVKASFASKDHTHGYKPEGTISTPNFEGTETVLTVNTTAEENIVSTVSLNHAHNYTPNGTISKPTFTGENVTITVGIPQ